MAYLTSDEYVAFGYEKADADKYDRALKNASMLINQVCSYYDPAFGYHSLEDDYAEEKDTWKYRQAQAFKNAVAQQVSFLLEANYASPYSIAQGNLKSFTVGHTSLDLNSSAGQALTLGDTGVLKSVYSLLGKYGLLFSGVSTR